MTTQMSSGTRAAAALAGALLATSTAACSEPQGQAAGHEPETEVAEAHAKGAETTDPVEEDLAVARAATAGYHRLEAATDGGYELPPAPAPLHECISAVDAPGAMGLHYINGTNVGDTVLDPARPAALVYEPTKNGRLRLVAAEYVVFAEAWDAEHPGETPQLFGRDLALVPEGNRYELPAFYQVHAWLWKKNPHGMHADHNTRVSCEFADG